MATTLYPGIPFSPQAQLMNNIGAADTIIEVSDISVFPAAPNLATIGTDEDGETILYAAKTATALSGCTRGVEGSARAWQSGDVIARNWTAKDHADLIAAITEAKGAATAAVTAHNTDLTAHEDIRRSIHDAVEAPGGATSDMPASLGAGPYTIEYTEDDPSEVSANQIGYDGTQSGIQADTVQGAIDALDSEVDQLGAEMELVSNENMLINSRWDNKENIINQRGQNEYTTPGYTIDMWFNENVNGTVNVLDTGVKFSWNRQSNEYAGIIQFLDAKWIIGKIATLSIVASGTGSCYLFTNDDYQTGRIKIDLTPEPRLYCLTTTFKPVTWSNWPVFRIISDGEISPLTGDIVLVAAKLELGSKQTLAHQDADGNWVLNDPPPNRALELIKCQQHYETGIHVTAFIDTELYDISVPYKVTKRINPSCTIVSNNGTVGKVSYYAGSSWVDFDINSIEPNKSDVRIVFNNPSETSCHIAFSIVADAGL